MTEMAYIDGSMSLSEDRNGEIIIHNKAPVKEIILACALLIFGFGAILGGVYMMYNKVGGDRNHGIAFLVLGCLLFLPGFYETQIAYYAYKGYKGFSFANIPAV